MKFFSLYNSKEKDYMVQHAKNDDDTSYIAKLDSAVMDLAIKSKLITEEKKN